MEITLQSKQRVLAAALVFGAVYVLMFSMGISKTHADTGYGNSSSSWSNNEHQYIHTGAYTNSPPVSLNNCWDDNQMRLKWDTDWNSYLSQKQNNEDWKTFYNRMGWSDMVSWHDRQINCDDNWNWKPGTNQNQTYNHDQYNKDQYNKDQNDNCDRVSQYNNTDKNWDKGRTSYDSWDKNNSSHDSWDDKDSGDSNKSYSYNDNEDE